MNSSKTKQIIIDIGLVLVAIVVAILLSELALRIVLPRVHKIQDRDLRIPSEKLGYTYIYPNKFFPLDKNGFKNHSVPVHADIVALGDSHTFGIYNSVEETWPYYLASSTNMSVYNMGLGGYGPIQYYALVDQALSFKPKYVVIGLLLANDFFDAYNMTYNGHLVDKSEYDYHHVAYNVDYWKDFRVAGFANDKPIVGATFNHEKIPLESVRVFIRNNSVLYDFLADRTYILREQLGLAKPHVLGTENWANNDPDVTLRWSENLAIDTIFWEGERTAGVDVNNKNIREGIRLTKDLLTKIQRKVENNGARLIVALIPTKETVYEPLLSADRIKQNKAFVEVLTNEKTLRKDMTDFCKSAGITCVDLLPGLEAALAKNNRLFPKTWDGHPLGLGYKYYAESIATVIKK
jgi:hypothetical protein